MGAKGRMMTAVLAHREPRWHRAAADLLMFKLTNRGAVERTGRGVYRIRRAA